MGLKVVAVLPEDKFGIFKDKRIKRGDEFVLDHEGQFSHRWMKAIGWKPKPAPKKKSTSSDVALLRKKLARAEDENAALAEANKALEADKAALEAKVAELSKDSGKEPDKPEEKKPEEKGKGKKDKK
jgi:hypothetical protein